MSLISRLNNEELSALAQSYLQKWMKGFSTPIDREQAIATISALYKQLGHSPPKVLFLDSPLAVTIATTALLDNAGVAQQRLHRKLLDYYEQCSQQLLDMLYNGNIRIPCIDEFSGRIPFTLHNRNEIEFGDSVPYGYRSSELETNSTLVPDLFSIAICDRNQDWCNNTYSQQQFERLSQQIDVSPDLLRARTLSNLTASLPIWSTHIPEAAIYDFAASTDRLAYAEPFISFVNSALRLECISPFQEVCFVSDRPQFKRNSQDRLHAIGEPAIYFSDGFGLAYFYNGTKLPHRYGILPPSQWQAQWLLEEQNAQLRQILIQEIGYARVCQELQLEELDSWREYTLLKLPIYDDHGPAVTWRATFQRPDEEAGATYLLKMTCPSTGLIYGLRVPPYVSSAREAATWINWGTDPEWFTIET
jgi:hypothetical protein